MKKNLFLLIMLITSIMLLSSCGNKNNTLKIGTKAWTETYNPFYYTLPVERSILDLTQAKLFPVDLNGNLVLNSGGDEGHEDEDGTVYYGAASLTVSKNIGDDTMYDYRITLRKDILTPDGGSLSYKDLIFNFYYILDSSYKGSSNFKDLPVLGVKDYQLDNTNNIEGIKLSGSSVVVTMTRKLTEEEMHKLNIYLCPLVYYGSPALFNYNANSFGFEKGKTKKSVSSKGAGRYYISSNNDSRIVLERNNAYYGSYPSIEKIVFVRVTPAIYDNKNEYRVSGGTEIEMLYDGDFDIALVEITPTVLDEVPRYNLNDELIGNVMSLIQFNDDSNMGYIISSKRLDSNAILSLNLSSKRSIYDCIDNIILK